MDSFSIIKCYHSQNPTVKFLNFSPKPKTIMFLTLNFEGIFYNFDAPFLF